MVEDRDRGYAALVRRVFGFRRPKIAVGVLEADGGRPHGDDALTIIEVATFNEFGTSRIPERSFIRAWFDEHQAELKADLGKMMQAVLLGRLTREQMLERLGQRCVGQIQARIAEGVPPPNAESTIRRKGSSKPLVDTGALRSSVSYRVDEG